MCDAEHMHAHREEFRTLSVIFNQEYDPSYHLGILTWWASARTQEHIPVQRAKLTDTDTHIATYANTDRQSVGRLKLRPPAVCWEFGSQRADGTTLLFDSCSCL